MSTAPILRTYVDSLITGTLEAILPCFTDDAVVHSPLYGRHLARDYFPVLLADSAPSTTTVRRTYTDPDNPTEVAVFFSYDWVLSNGVAAPMDVVDLITLTEDRTKISQLVIVYDTSSLRGEWEKVATLVAPLSTSVG